MVRLMTQFAVGATLTALLVHLCLPAVRYRLTVVVAGGLWALIPDILLLGPVPADAVGRFMGPRLLDLFWFHGTLNEHVTGEGFRPTAALTIGALLCVVWLTEQRRDHGRDSG